MEIALTMKNLDPSLARVIRALGISHLNEVQQTASNGGLFSTQDDFALVSQSRTGKSFVGVLLVANELFKLKSDDGLAIIIAPFHASARETATLVSQIFGWFLRPLVLVGEVQQTEIALRLSKGMAPNVIIATPDALRDLIRGNTTREWLLSRNVAVTVFDDVHSILHDPSRGSMLIELSDFFKEKCSQSPRRLFLSAEFDNPERLKQLFDVRIIKDKNKYVSPTFDLVKYSAPKDKKKQLVQLIENLAEEGKRTLVYMKPIGTITKFLDEHGSSIAELASYDIDPLVRSRLEKIACVLDELEYEYDHLVTHGIGCYHGLMQEEHRWFIEWAFRRKHLRFLFGTEALAYGVNTPVSHVVMESPGIDEIFRQSMMARAIRMRRGKGHAGRCTVYAKSIKDVGSLQRVYENPNLPVRFITNHNISNLLLGLIGLDLLNNETQRTELSERLELLFKKGSTGRVLNELVRAKPPLVEKVEDTKLRLTPLGALAFESVLSGEQVERVVEGLQLLSTTSTLPTIYDLLLILNHASILESESAKSKKEIDEDHKKYLKKSVDSVLLNSILDTKLEPQWQKSVEFSTLLLNAISNTSEFEPSTRKSVDRLVAEIRLFSMNLVSFLSGLQRIDEFVQDESKLRTITTLLDLLNNESFIDLLFGPESESASLRFRDLSFVDFGDIERTIDFTLTSDLTSAEKIQLLELLDTVESTTSAFIDLLERSQDDEDARAALETVLEFSKEGIMGKNLIRALEEEGLVERGQLDQLMHSFSTRVDNLQKRTDAPAKAAKVMIALFSGDVVGLATSGYNALRMILGRRKVDTRGMS